MKRLFALSMTATLPALAFAMGHGHSKHHQMHQDHLPNNANSREIVEFPAPVYELTLKSMREHLEAIHTVIEAVASEDYAKASLAAEKDSASVINMALTDCSQGMHSCPQGCANWVTKCT